MSDNKQPKLRIREQLSIKDWQPKPKTIEDFHAQLDGSNPSKVVKNMMPKVPGAPDIWT